MRIEAGDVRYRLDDRTLTLDQAGLEINVLRTLLAAIDKAGLEPADVSWANVQPDCVDLTVITWTPSGRQACTHVRHVEL